MLFSSRGATSPIIKTSPLLKILHLSLTSSHNSSCLERNSRSDLANTKASFKFYRTGDAVNKGRMSTGLMAGTGSTKMGLVQKQRKMCTQLRVEQNLHSGKFQKTDRIKNPTADHFKFCSLFSFQIVPQNAWWVPLETVMEDKCIMEAQRGMFKITATVAYLWVLVL